MSQAKIDAEGLANRRQREGLGIFRVVYTCGAIGGVLGTLALQRIYQLL